MSIYLKIKNCNIYLHFFLLFSFLMLSTCSLERELDDNNFNNSTKSLDPGKYIVPALSATKAEMVQVTTKGVPVDSETQIADFGFFCSYTGQVKWGVAATNAPTKMFNRKMESYYDLTHPYPLTLLWRYAATPIVEWNAAAADDLYSFFGYAPYATGEYHVTTNPTGNGITVTSTATDNGIPKLSYTVPTKVENQPDLMVAKPVYDLVPTGHPVQLHMEHALTAIGFRIAGSFGEKVTQLSITGVYTSGNLTKMDGDDILWSMVGSPTTTDYSSSLNYDFGQSYYTVSATYTNPLKNDGWLMMIPQALEPTAKVRITLSDGVVREVSLLNSASTVIDTWEAGKRIVYDISATPFGGLTVFPRHTILSCLAHTPAEQRLTVICQKPNGDPDDTIEWTLAVPPSATSWLQLTLDPTGATGVGSSVSGIGTKAVYLITLSENLSTSPRIASLILNGDQDSAATVVEQEGLLDPQHYHNWLYVRKGGTGSGTSWANALPTISDGIYLAGLLTTKPNGILVAGGVYPESFTVSTGIKIYGGWTGASGTELLPGATVYDAPFPVTTRNLVTHKATVDMSSGGVTIGGANAVLDGFVFRNGTGSGLGVDVFGGAFIHAVEVVNNSFSSNRVLTLNNATAVNILVANNTTGIDISTSSRMINATIVRNTGSSVCNTSLMYNCAWWTNGLITFNGSYSLRNCATDISGLPANGSSAEFGDNVPIHANNTAWFSTSPVTNVVPGPHFNLSSESGHDPIRPVYAALNDRCPLLGRGNQTLFDNNTMIMTTKLDINGNARHQFGTDIGCYEGDGGNADGIPPHQDFKGFVLRWNMYDFYISSRANFTSEHPLLLVDNHEQVDVEWTVTANSVTGNHAFTLPYAIGGEVTGSGDGVMVGTFNMRTGPVAHTANTTPSCGTVTIHTSLGPYLPNQTLNVYRIPGVPNVWHNGYVGSFHRNNETRERRIFGNNTGAWTVRIIMGLEWIKVDNYPRGYNGGEVIEQFGGQVTGTGAIAFRVGLKSTLPPGHAPRYGLILIQRGGGAAMFFVRQGEEADYIYAPTDPRPANGDRTSALKISPFNIVAPEYYTYNGAQMSNHDIGPGNGAFTDYPSKVGSYFQWNKTRSYMPDLAPGSMPSSHSSFDPAREVCPPGFRHASELEFVQSVYRDRPTGVTEPGNVNFRDNFVWGRLADGYFDRLAGDRDNVYWLGAGYGRATFGVLMVNHATMASVFFPATSVTATSRASAGNAYVPNLYLATNGSYRDRYCFYPTSTFRSASSPAWTTHWCGSTDPTSGHIGMSCTTPGTSGIPVRCFKVP